MSVEQILLALVGVACSILGWFARVLYGAVNELRKDLNVLEVKITQDYVRYDRLRDAMEPILEALKRIEGSLHNKVDKP